MQERLLLLLEHRQPRARPLLERCGIAFVHPLIDASCSSRGITNELPLNAAMA